MDGMSSPLCQTALSIVEPEAGLQPHMNSNDVWLAARYLLCFLATWYNEGCSHLPRVAQTVLLRVSDIKYGSCLLLAN